MKAVGQATPAVQDPVQDGIYVMCSANLTEFEEATLNV